MADVFDSLRAHIETAEGAGATYRGDRTAVIVDDMKMWLAEIERLQVHAGQIRRVFVTSVNFHDEGHTPPIQAFLIERDAIAAMKFLGGTGHSEVDLYAVPVWPEHAVRWMDQKPIGCEEA